MGESSAAGANGTAGRLATGGDRPRRAWPWWGAAVLIYLAAALWQLYPAWTDLQHGVVGDWLHPDTISNHWLYRWIPEQLLSGGSILHNDRYYLPVGDAPWLAGNGSDAVIHTPLALLLDWPGRITVWMILTVVLNGLSGFALSRQVGATARGALVGGLCAATLPYVCYEMAGGRFAQAPLYWPGFFLASWIALLRRPGAARGVTAGVLFALCAFEYWYHGLWAALAGAVIFAFRPRFRALATFVPTALALTLPPLLVFLHHWSEIPGTESPAFPHPLALESALPPTFPAWGGEGPRGGLVLSLVALALAWAGWRTGRNRPEIRALVVVAGIFYLLTLGPRLTLPDQTRTAIPGPYLLVYGILPALKRFWWPYRHQVIVALALLPLTALGAEALLQRTKRRAPLLLAALLLGIPLDLALRTANATVPASWWEPPEPYRTLADLPGEALLELPVAPSLGRSQQSLSYQWVHGRDLVNGHAMWVDRVRPPAWDTFVQENTFLSALRAYERGESPDLLTFEAQDIAALRTLGVRHLSLNTEYLPGRLTYLAVRYPTVLEPIFGDPVITWKDRLWIWDLARYTGKEQVHAPPYDPTDQSRAEDGTRMPQAGPIVSLGWRPFLRHPPEQAPPPDSTNPPMPEMLRRKLSRTDLHALGIEGNDEQGGDTGQR